MNQIALFLGDVAGSEILVILLVILLFFGSKSIPGIAKTFGKTMYQIRNASNELQNEIKKSSVGIKEELNVQSLLKDAEDQINQPLDQVYTNIENSVHYSGKPSVEPLADVDQPSVEAVDNSADSMEIDDVFKESNQDENKPSKSNLEV